MLEGTTIAVTSGKGGVGKSTVSANLALALSRLGKKVALIDLDVYGFSIPKILNISDKPKTMNGKMIPIGYEGMGVMSIGFISKGNEPIVWRGPMIGKVLEHFFNDVIWGKVDYTILDMPPGTGDIALDMHQMLPNSKELIVTTPHPNATHVAERAGKMAQKSNHDIVGVVENMSYFTPPTNQDERYYLFGKGGGEALASSLNTEVVASIPMSIPNEDGEVPAIATETSNLFEHYNRLARTIDRKLSVPTNE
ncbi:Mrp/NBP35 family ATP-binding protein [Desertibacillus haloalkaliphilus]|uniref:Mrp/NBP35 family ATP-binding protein n=1 Tax=Desertibacillus haloalkaliphilus TaxID=1328930 RepID=UPI001C267239|nr:Mrp/NBP35 family ATP-binding protein [Desertibacillus haloalkaliphilus]MBU8908326.1 Mrp/NBP35 family ATP-binding protein [Desertibacillus haloalkaliphilus]